MLTHKLTRLYVGSKGEDGTPSAALLLRWLEECGLSSLGCTYHRTRGVWEGKLEESLVIEFVYPLCHTLTVDGKPVTPESQIFVFAELVRRQWHQTAVMVVTLPCQCALLVEAPRFPRLAVEALDTEPQAVS